MSRFVAKIIGFILLLMVFPAIAQEAAQPVNTEALQGEIVYRTSLGRADDIVILLKQGASANAVSDAGIPIIALAASRIDGEGAKILKILIEAGADTSKIDTNGQTALFYAAKFGNVQAAEYLLAKGTPYGATDNSGNTARSIAYDAFHKDIVEILDNFVRGKNEETRKQYAIEIQKQYETIYKQLEERYKAYNKSDVEVKNSANSAVAALQKAVYEMSYAACDAAYFQHFNSAHKPTELKDKELANAIYSNRLRRDSRSNSLINVAYMEKSLVYKIINLSDVQIVYQLGAAENGQKMGTVKDMEAKCGAIAASWINETGASQ